MRTLTVTRRRAGTGWVWRATVGFRNVAVEKTIPTNGEDSLVGGDRGVKVTLALSDGTMVTMPRWMAAARDDIVELQRQRATKRKYSRAWKQLNRQIATKHRQVAQRADNWARETANTLVADFDVVVLEDLNLVAMTRSARGTVEAPGTNVSAKAGLNRSLQDAALGRLAHWICVKAESAGRRVWLVDPRHTSQRCSSCSHTDAANRPDQATFACVSCGHSANADVNAAANVSQLGEASEQAWAKVGRPSLERRKPRMRRGVKDKPKVAHAS
jgi:putative transposase